MKKTKTLQLKAILTILICSGLLFTSCTDDNEGGEVEISSAELSSAYEISDIDNTSESINDIVENAYLEVELDVLLKQDDSKENHQQRFFSDCVVVTKEITDISKKVVLDYGDGCTTKKDDVVSGKILMTIVKDRETSTVTIDYTFEDFYFNDKEVEGTVHKVRIKENENGFPQAVITKDVIITWEDDAQARIEGERKREMIEGSGNLHWGDNVFLVTGSWTHTKRNGVVKKSTIIEPLKRTMACRFLVSGIIEIEKNDTKRQIDYGDGTCDSKATLIKGGVSKEFQLKKRKN